jgi:hypothetical protein
MIESLPPIEVLTPSALLGLTIFLILRGYIVPRRTLEEKAHEANEWRAESRIKDQQIHELTEQNTAMLREFGPTVTAFMDALRKHADEKEAGK